MQTPVMPTPTRTPPTGVRVRTSKFTPIRLGDGAEKDRPFRAALGNAMMATRRLQEEADEVGGRGRGGGG